MLHWIESSCWNKCLGLVQLELWVLWVLERKDFSVLLISYRINQFSGDDSLILLFWSLSGRSTNVNQWQVLWKWWIKSAWPLNNVMAWALPDLHVPSTCVFPPTVALWLCLLSASESMFYSQLSDGFLPIKVQYDTHLICLFLLLLLLLARTSFFH